ncbi:MAG: hypothetical protein V4850_07965 [Myxococcota bacterium]
MPSLIPCLLLFASIARADVVEPVGTFGASIELDESWKRDVIAPALGADQFHDDTGLYMAVTEIRGTFLDAEDMRRRMKQQTLAFESQAGKPLTPVNVAERGGVLHAEQQWQLKVRGISIVYDVHIFARGGLAYLLLTWSAEKQALQLRRAGKQLVRRFHMPGADSAWARLATPVVEENEIVGHQIRFAYPPDQLGPIDEETRSDAFAGLTSPDNMLSVYFLLESSETGLEGLLDGAVAAASSLTVSVEHTERFDLVIDGRPARVALLDGTAAASPLSAAVAVIPVAEGVFLDVRFVTYGKFASRRALWEALVRTIDVEERPRVDAFPVVEARPTPIPLAPQQRALLEASRSVGVAPRANAWRLSGTDVYAQSYRSVTVMSLVDGATTTLDLGEEVTPSLPATRPDGLYVPVGDGIVVRRVGEKDEPVAFSAKLVADAGEHGLLLVRAPEARLVPGFAPLAAPTGQRLLLRADAGTERFLLDLRDRRVDDLVVDRGEALLALSHVDRPYDDAELVIVDLTTAATRTLGGAWQSVNSVAAGPDGWVVTGAPRDQTAGVYRITRTGERSLLMSGRHVAAFPLEAGELFLVTTWHPPDVPAEEYTLLGLRVPAAALAAHGPRFDPLTTSHVRQMAVAALGTLNLASNPTGVMADPATIRRFVEAASRASEARVGVPLPRDAEGIDRLLADAIREGPLGQEAYLLLSALLTDYLLAQKATWAAGKGQTNLTLGIDLEPSNDHALGYLPLELVRSTLYDSEGWWNPATTIRDRLDGRALVIGVDLDAVQARVNAAERTGRDALLENGKVAEIVAWLALEPTNVYLRDEVYTGLAAVGRASDLVVIAEPFLAKAPRAYADVRASLAGRFTQALTPAGLDPERYPALVADLRAAIAEFPEASALYVLLAHVYEKGGAADGPLLAAACYHHVDEATEWSEFRKEVKAAIARLEP